ncbi:hypothetical protein VP03_15495 [Sinorhizobium meliloti]|nr:hypothetical protein VP03_15495 [Sinorhizobium meliloti]
MMPGLPRFEAHRQLPRDATPGDRSFGDPCQHSRITSVLALVQPQTTTEIRMPAMVDDSFSPTTGRMYAKWLIPLSAIMPAIPHV